MDLLVRSGSMVKISSSGTTLLYKLTVFSKSDDEGGQKSFKNDDVFYERPLT